MEKVQGLKSLKNNTTMWLTKVAIFSTMGIVLYSFGIFKFPLPFLFPNFLEINISLLPSVLCGFLTGPVGGVISVIIKGIVKMLYSSSSVFVGEIVDIIIGGVVVLVTSLIYKFFHTKKGAISALLFGTLAWVVTAVFTNYFVAIPLYIRLYFNGNEEILINMLQVLPGVVDSTNYMWKYLVFAVVPFNILIALINNIVIFIVYKRISVVFKHNNFEETDE